MRTTLTAKLIVYVVIIQKISCKSEYVDSIYQNKDAALIKAEEIEYNIGEEFEVFVEGHEINEDFVDTSKRF